MIKLLIPILLSLFCINGFCETSQIDSLEAIICSQPENQKISLIMKLHKLHLKEDNFVRAEEYLTIHRHLANKSGTIDDHLNNLLAGSNFYITLKNDNEAIKKANEALKLTKCVEDSTLIRKAIIKAGVAFVKTGDLKRALNLFTHASYLDSTKGLAHNYAWDLTKIAWIYREINDYQKAMKYYQSSLRIGQKFQDTTLIMYNYRKIANIYLHEKNPKGLYYIDEQIKYHEKKENLSALYFINRHLGCYYYHIKDYKQSISIFEKTLQLADGKQTLPFYSSVLQMISNSYSQLGDYQEAFAYNEKAAIVNRNIKARAALKLQLSHDYVLHKNETEIELQKNKAKEKREALIKNFILLSLIIALAVTFIFMTLYFRSKRSQYILSQKVASLKESNEVYDQLFTILTKDFSNSFNVIVGSSALLDEEYKQLSDPERKMLIKSISKNSRNSFTSFNKLITWKNKHDGQLQLPEVDITLDNAFEKTA